MASDQAIAFSCAIPECAAGEQLMKASVVIPTKNGGVLFARVLDALLQQKTLWDYEILVVDSGSSDNTVRYCEERNINVISILPSDFGHGKTRNFAMSKTTGEFIALITQDALPASNEWLFNLVSAVEQAPDVAGAFGRHLPYPEADPYMTRDLKLHFDRFLNWPAVMRKSDNEARYAAELGYRQVMHFFSDNNACLRRSVWEKYPYPEVDFAEDQIWAKIVTEAGYGKAYADNAAVYHSHNYSVIEAGRRAFDEAMALNKLFGYKLCPTLTHLLTQVIRTSAADIRHSMRQPNRGGQIYYMARAPFYNISRMTGFYLGTHATALPKEMSRTLSLDRSLKENRSQKPGQKHTG